MVGVILESYKILQKSLSKAVNQRFGQQVGILLAGYWSLRSDSVITAEGAEAIVTARHVAGEANEAKDTDQMEALNTLCTTGITIQLIDDRKVHNIVETIGEIIHGRVHEKVTS